MQDIRKIIIKRMKQLSLTAGNLGEQLSDKDICGRTTFCDFISGASLGHDKLQGVFHVLGLEIRSKK